VLELLDRNPLSSPEQGGADSERGDRYHERPRLFRQPFGLG
jgi:hypothetical protein